ncbi:MAG: hydroxyethylthiazole kinase [Opitutaceae bacterium]|nr:hydroxyethylthiazole kinase [Opitutaceae bacterium]
MSTPATTLANVVEILERLRARRPLVHCLTNQVVKGFTANVLLALGAAPAMVEHPDEAGQFAGIADALLVNVGTLDEAQMAAIRVAMPAANAAQRPWVFDPVAVGPLGVRTRFASDVLAHRPTVIRGNASEVMALAGLAGGGRGVDSGAESTVAREAARTLARQTGGAVLVTGQTDYAIDSAREVAAANGHILMTRVTGVGCAMGAINAACLAVADSPLAACVATAVLLGLAGERAAAVAARPGSFAVALLDALDALDADTVRAHGRIC